jgi:hypothetical protein
MRVGLPSEVTPVSRTPLDLAAASEEAPVGEGQQVPGGVPPAGGVARR